MSTPITNGSIKIIDQGDFLIFQTKAFFSVVWSGCTWAFLALVPYFLFVLIPKSIAVKAWGIIAAMILISVIMLWFPFFVSTCLYKLIIDSRDKTYRLTYGLLPLRFFRSGSLRDFVGVEVGQSTNNYTQAVGLAWRDARMPFRVRGNGLGIASCADKYDAQDFGKWLAERLELPLVEKSSQIERK